MQAFKNRARFITSFALASRTVSFKHTANDEISIYESTRGETCACKGWYRGKKSTNVCTTLCPTCPARNCNSSRPLVTDRYRSAPRGNPPGCRWLPAASEAIKNTLSYRQRVNYYIVTYTTVLPTFRMSSYPASTLLYSLTQLSHTVTGRECVMTQSVNVAVSLANDRRRA